MSKQIPLPSRGGCYVFDGEELVLVTPPTLPPVGKTEREASAAPAQDEPAPANSRRLKTVGRAIHQVDEE